MNRVRSSSSPEPPIPSQSKKAEIKDAILGDLVERLKEAPVFANQNKNSDMETLAADMTGKWKPERPEKERRLTSTEEMFVVRVQRRKHEGEMEWERTHPEGKGR